MRSVRTTTLAAALLLAVCGASAQTPEEIIAEAREKRVTLDYACSISELSPVRIRGELVLQGDCYYVEGNGMEVYCDGLTRWTVDIRSKEVYVEDAGGIGEVLSYRDSVSGLKLSHIRYSELSDDLSAFTFDTSALDSSWIVTDLRGL